MGLCYKGKIVQRENSFLFTSTNARIYISKASKQQFVLFSLDKVNVQHVCVCVCVCVLRACACAKDEVNVQCVCVCVCVCICMCEG